MSQKMVLVIGGAASGKSAFAEKLIADSGLEPIYLATSRIWDDEIKVKIARHRQMRGAGWTTLDVPLEPSDALGAYGENAAVLLDCVTMWLTNHLMDENDLEAAQTRLLDGLAQCAALRVVVSNEVGGGIVPENALARTFRQAQGEVNQLLAARSDVVVQVVAGLPNVLKGVL